MDKPLKFWNGEKIQKNIFNDSLGNVIKFAIWTGSKCPSVIRACVIKRHVYKIVTIKDKDEMSDNNNKKYEFKLPDGEENILGGTQTVDWNPEHENQIAVGMANSYVLHWNIETAKCIRMHKAIYENTSTLSRTLTCIQWSTKDPNILIYGTKDPIIKVWDVRQESTVQEKILDGVLDIKFDPFDGNQFAVASENHDVMIYDLRYPASEKTRSDKKPQVSRKFKFSAHENRTLKCEWNPNVRNRLATSGQNNIKIWDLDYSKESHLQQERTRITTRHSAYSIKWSPLCENLLASHSHSSKYVEIWDINRRFRPYRHFKEEPICKEGWHHQSKLGKLLLHWHETPHALLTLNTSNADLSMHARRDAISMENFAPSCALSCSPRQEVGFTVSPYKTSKRIATTQLEAASDKSYIFTKPLSVGEDCSEKFQYFALNYSFAGDTMENLCLNNAKIAEEIGLLHIGSNWRLLHILHASSDTTLPFHVEESNFESQRRSKRSGTVSSDRHLLTSESPEESLEQESDSDHLLDYRHPATDTDFRPSYQAEGEYRPSYPGTEDEPSEHDDFNPEQSVKNYQWEMLDEPFTTQESLVNLDHSTECEELSDLSSVPDPEQGLYSSSHFQPDNMASVRHNKTDMRINTLTLTFDMLEDLVSEGDVQTACTMLLVLENKLVKSLDPGQEQIVGWFHAYVDILSRFRLWSVQAAVVAKAPEQIKILNGKSCISAMCSKCTTEKLRNGLCSECGPVAVCSLCRLAVRGLYVWCQGCCHGGHPEHIEQWFSGHKLCPAACGHECQFY